MSERKIFYILAQLFFNNFASVKERARERDFSWICHSHHILLMVMLKTWYWWLGRDCVRLCEWQNSLSRKNIVHTSSEKVWTLVEVRDPMWVGGWLGSWASRGPAWHPSEQVWTLVGLRRSHMGWERARALASRGPVWYPSEQVPWWLHGDLPPPNRDTHTHTYAHDWKHFLPSFPSLHNCHKPTAYLL